MAIFKLLLIGLIGTNLVNCQQDHDHSGHDHANHRVNVTVYYESLCPDSIKFMTKQLYPALQTKLSEFINLILLPYGRAKTTQTLNQYDFICRHGPNECYTNKLHVCALNLVIKKDQMGFNKVATSFINCLMEKIQPGGGEQNNPNNLPVNNCAVISNVQNLNDIQNCANHVQGSELLAGVGKVTESLTPPLRSVPTIVFNNKYKEDDTQMAQTDFIKTVCKYIEHDKPAECQTNSSLPTQLSYMIILGALLMNYIM